MIDTKTLPLQLKKLRLNTFSTAWEEISQQAESQHWSYPQYLAALCGQELATREQNSIQQNIKNAKLPLGKTLDTFNFKGLTTITGAQINAFAETTGWISQAQNLIFFGPSGVGKTHLAAAIGRRLSEQGVKVFFTKTTALVQQLQVAYAERKLSELLAKLAKFELLILDDIGYVKKTEAETSVLFELIADRYETKSLIITANQPFSQWDTIFPSSIMAVAAIDRLVHHATIININEPSYRKTTQKALINQAPK